MPSECTHEAKWWRIPWSGEGLCRAHPPIRGKQWAIPEEQWDRSQRRPRQPQGPRISNEMAALPLEFNKMVSGMFCDRNAATCGTKTQLAAAQYFPFLLATPELNIDF